MRRSRLARLAFLAALASLPAACAYEPAPAPYSGYSYYGPGTYAPSYGPDYYYGPSDQASPGRG